MIYFEMAYSEDTYRRFFDTGVIPKRLEFPYIDYDDFNLFFNILARATEICAENHSLFFSQDIRDSLALYAMWRTGVSGTTQDPFDLSRDAQTAQALILLSSTYREWDILSSEQYFDMMPTMDELAILMSGGRMLHRMFEYNMEQDEHGETYGHIDLNVVDSFWAHIPKISLDNAGYQLKSENLLASFTPEKINQLFGDDEDLKWFYQHKVIAVMDDFIPARRIAHPETSDRDLRRFPDSFINGEPLTLHKNQIYNDGFPLWILTVLQVQYSWFLSKSFAAIE